MLTANTYGKQEVHVVKVDRSSPEHRIMDVVVRVLLTGRGLAESYTEADNRWVVPTDTCKNVIYVVAKQCAMNTIEEYGIALTAFFLKTYAHIETVEATLSQTPMARLAVDGKPHTHSFQPLPVRWTAVVQQKRGGLPVVRSGVRDLMVLKTTGSGWDRYHECKYTTLKPTTDRILKTDVVCQWTYLPVADPAS